VDRGADRSREPLVPLEGRNGPGVPDQLLDDLVEVTGGGTRDSGHTGGDQRPSDDTTGRLHGVQLTRGTRGDHALAGPTEHGGRQQPSAASARALISSTSPTASMLLTSPA